jgi:hypothetical protein
MSTGSGERIAALFSSDIPGTARSFQRRLNRISNETQRKRA